ncbi:MAG: DUF5606 domain-containing protein [Bacteroidetes bacterium]|nr:DUF5606 domain-containing protein [Bacteroidota bacterium]
MNLEGIISIGGMPGLYKAVGQMKNGVIAESLSDKKRTPVYSHQQISSLEDISMFTTGDNKAISDIMKSIYEKEKGGACIDHKADEKEIIAYFASILPDYDKERVHPSNMRKLFNWYNILHKTENLKLKELSDKKEEKTKTSSDEKAKTHTPKQHKPDTAKVAVSKGVKKTTGVRKTGTA